MAASSSNHRAPDAGTLARSLGPLLAGAIVVIVGAIVASANDWSTGALWALAVGASVVAAIAFAVPAAMRAPSLRSTTGRTPMTIGTAVAKNVHPAGELSPDRVLVLSGRSRSGKSTIAAHLIEQHPDWARASCGDYVRAQAQARGVEPRLPETHALGQALVEEFGGERFLDAVLEHARVPEDARTLVVDDVYHVAVFEALRERWQHLRFVSVDLPESVRRSLLHSQGLNDAQVDQIEESPLDQAVGQLERHYEPERRLPGAATADEAVAVTRQIGELLAA